MSCVLVSSVGARCVAVSSLGIWCCAPTVEWAVCETPGYAALATVVFIIWVGISVFGALGFGALVFGARAGSVWCPAMLAGAKLAGAMLTGALLYTASDAKVSVLYIPIAAAIKLAVNPRVRH